MAHVAPGGGNYTYAQLEGLWIKAGGKKALAPIMAAIAMAESRGNPNAKNPSGATGLWQILGAVNPGDQAHLTDPAVNAHEAVLKYKSQGLGAWTTYTSGAYKAYLNSSTSPNLNVPGSKGGSGSTGTSATLTSAQTDTCLLATPSVLFISGGCIFSKTNARALIGGLLLLAGASAGLVGLAVLTLGAFGDTKAGAGAKKVVGTAAEIAGGVTAVAGAPEVGAPVAAAGAAAKRKGKSAPRKQVAAAPRQPSEAEVRAQLRARADQVSTRVPARSS